MHNSELIGKHWYELRSGEYIQLDGNPYKITTIKKIGVGKHGSPKVLIEFEDWDSSTGNSRLMLARYQDEKLSTREYIHINSLIPTYCSNPFK